MADDSDERARTEAMARQLESSTRTQTNDKYRQDPTESDYRPTIIDARMELDLSETEKLKWCPEPESNQRHADFQSAALPTELSGHTGFIP